MSTLESALGQKASRFIGVRNVDFESGAKAILLEDFTVILETEFLRFLPIPDTDEVHFEIGPIDSIKSNVSLIEIEGCGDFVNSTFSEFWKSTNSRGYLDQLVLGFKNLHPSILILSEGSVLKLFRVLRF